MKVKDLIEILSKVDENVEAKCRWDGYDWAIDAIYVDGDGLIIDSGNEIIDYKGDPNVPVEMLYEREK